MTATHSPAPPSVPIGPADSSPSPALPSAAPLEIRSIRSLLAEPYAFALLTWPAVIALLTPLSAGWVDGLRAALIFWLATMQLAAYTGGRGFSFGNAMLLTSGIVALACDGFPSAWTLAGLPALLITLHAAQHALLARLAPVDGAAIDDRPDLNAPTIDATSHPPGRAGKWRYRSRVAADRDSRAGPG